VIACKDWNQLNPGPVSWRKQQTHEVDDQFFPLAFGCNHCDEPACVSACAAAAISKDENGIVRVDRDKCINLLACISACPFAKPQIALDKQEPDRVIGWQVGHPMQKCDMCYSSRIKNGLKPACTLSCPGRALDFGTADYITATYPDAERLNKTAFPYAYADLNAADTGPNLFIKPAVNVINVVKTSPSYTGKRTDV
jgi:anaerobic dimethyl sulfoxide reductase subunit B (iron-sulfur subunit)